MLNMRQMKAAERLNPVVLWAVAGALVVAGSLDCVRRACSFVLTQSTATTNE